MATPVLNNGIFLRENSYTTSSNVDQYHMMNMLGGSEPTDMGPIDIWAMAQKVEMPLYQMANFGGQNIKMVDDYQGRFKYRVPIANDLPYFMEDIEPGNVRKGIDGTTFKVKINKRAFGHGDIFTYDKMNGVELYITQDDIIPSGDAWIYTVQLVNNDNFKYLDNKYLKTGTKVFRKSSARSGEYGERYSDIGEITAGYREFYNYVGGHEAHVEYGVSHKAALMARGGLKADGTVPVIELWKNFDKNLDPAINSLETMAKTMGKDYMQKAIASGTLSKTFLTAMEGAHLTKIAKDIEGYLMWGQGGRLRQDGPDDIRLSIGLWKQLDNSFKRIYNKGSFTLDIFKSEIFNFFNGKVEFEGPDPNRTIIVQTGMAGMRLVSQAIQKEVTASGLVLNATEIGAVTQGMGKGMDLGFGFAYTHYTIPYLANMKFVLNPAFDPVNTNDIENPIIDGYPLTSYNFIVFDITDNNNDNIYLLKSSFDNQLKWHYENGDMDYMGRTSGFQSSGRFSGFKVRMHQNMPAIWVKDPTKVLKIVMRNPITGGSY